MAHHYEDGPDTKATNERIKKKMSHHHYEDVIDTSKRTVHPNSKQAILEKEKEIEKLQEEREKLVINGKIKNTKAFELSNQLQSLKETRENWIKRLLEQEKNFTSSVLTKG